MRSLYGMATCDPEEVDGLFVWRGEFRLRKEQSCHCAGHALFAEELCLMFGYRKSAVGKAHAPLEEKASQRIRAAKSAVDFGVQGAYEHEFEMEQSAAIGRARKAKPSIHKPQRNPAAPACRTRMIRGKARKSLSRAARYRSVRPRRIRMPSRTMPSIGRCPRRG